ncbi:MAG: B12-binding domain-containing radical SAM protein [Deltaproteobacteria bacterium]|nr:B12-binding domain-containing radical SAM protein [Deltaproteobacteria bacterium]
MALVALIHPELSFEPAYPLGLACLVSTLRRDGHRAIGVDLRMVRGGRAMQAVAAARADVVGIPVCTRNKETVFSLAREIALHCRIPVVLGGPHATLCPGECLSREGVAGVVRGDGETVFSRVVDALSGGGDAALEGWVPRSAPASPGGCAREPDLDALPWPDREVFPAIAYAGHPLRRGLFAPVVTSRGCGFRCSFCAAPAVSGTPRRVRSTGAVVDEILCLRNRFGITDVLLEDDQFLENREHVLHLCDALRSAGVPVRWHLPNGVRVDCVDQGILRAIRAAGCASIALGVESGAAEVRASLGRPCDEGRVRDVVRHAHAAGLSVTGYFMLGLPGGSAADDWHTFRFSRAIPFDLAHFSTYEWTPGCAIPERCGRRGTDRAIRAAAYLGFYASPVRIARLTLRGDIAPARAGAALKRFAAWLGEGVAD